ncbi:winged helix-turn-helix domain-containing protein [Cellulomonas sp. KH9]|uniref:winged helix-turn-helix domain-containing protein n=1 Tax=Cellulomonas sp. KH9 TaxID=1855324 RepID=UPI0008E5742E|nr:winged helix-turn-helix domain-containing protein [Cellulomonas sp. KH9]SFK46870.1 hypothetical protein SAMN05216467_3461 [Cellulomonas sp. KH9]
MNDTGEVDRGQVLLPIFRTPAQGTILATLLLDEDREANIADLARAAGVAAPNALREVNRLVQAGVLTERRVGRSRLVRADPSSPFVEPLRQILSRTHGPAQMVAEALDALPGVEIGMIIGSWAARTLGHPGPPPRDLDVLVVGDPPPRELRRANARLEEQADMPVQITVLAPADWHEARSGFVQSVQAGPHLVVVRRAEGDTPT